MSDFQRIDYDSEILLRVLSTKPANLNNLSFSTGLSLKYLAEHMSFLISKGYISNVALEPTEGLNLHDPYFITLNGKSYLENVDRMNAKEKRQRMINRINMTIALIALVKSFFPEFISLWKLLMQ